MTTWDYQPGGFTPVTQTERVRTASQEWTDQQFYAIVTDLVGTPMELVDAAGELAWRQVWGNLSTRCSALSRDDHIEYSTWSDLICSR